MGNSIGNGREEKWGDVFNNEDGDDPSVRSRTGFSEVTDRSWRAESPDSMDGMNSSSPLGSPRMSISPFPFSHQVPVTPVYRAADSPSVFSNAFTNYRNGPLDLPLQEGVPTVITWSYGGNEVAVEGSWDNWTSRKPLAKSRKDHEVLLVLRNGVYHYRFIVDGEMRYIPNEPYLPDAAGHFINILDVTDYVPENIQTVAQFEPPPSPDSSYNSPYTLEEDADKVPVVVPDQLRQAVIEKVNEMEEHLTLQHVNLEHVFIEKGWSSQNLVGLSVTQRFRSKYVTVIFYKPSNFEGVTTS